MFRCWSCGNDYADVPYSTRAEAKMWEDQLQERQNYAYRDALDKYRTSLIESYKGQGFLEENQQGILDGLRLAIMVVANTKIG